jgi:hypothetical protein
MYAQRVPVHHQGGGTITDIGYQRCVEVANILALEFVTITTENVGMTETGYEDWVEQKKRELGGSAYDHQGAVMVVYNGCNYLGGVNSFFVWARRVYDCNINSTWLSEALLNTTPSNNTFSKHPNADERHSFVEMEVTYGESKEETTVGTIRIELYEELCPRGCANFKSLCSGANENGATYVGTPFHRVVRGGYVQGGGALFCLLLLVVECCCRFIWWNMRMVDSLFHLFSPSFFSFLSLSFLSFSLSLFLSQTTWKDMVTQACHQQMQLCQMSHSL